MVEPGDGGAGCSRAGSCQIRPFVGGSGMLAECEKNGKSIVANEPGAGLSAQLTLIAIESAMANVRSH